MSADPPDLDGGDSTAEGSPTIFVSDPSVEADRLSTALRGRGYTVIDVPLSLLLARVAVQTPSIILLDIDADGALEVAARLHEIPGTRKTDVLFLGHANTTFADHHDALRDESSGFLVRPVDVPLLLDHVDLLVRARRGADTAIGEPPAPISVSPKAPASLAGRMPASARHSGAPLSRAAMASPTATLPLPSLSPEIERLLHAAEERSRQEPGAVPSAGARVPSPEEEIDSVLPAEVLAALDEPFDESDDDDESDSGLSTGPMRRATTSPPPQRTTPPSSADSDVSSSAPRELAKSDAGDSPKDPKQLETPRPPQRRSLSADAAAAVAPPPSLPSIRATTAPPPALARASRPSRASAPVDPVPTSRPSEASPVSLSLELPQVLGPGDALRGFALCVRSRGTGALCIEVPAGIRRVLLRDGDVVTVASGLDDESLVAFLESRGDIVPAMAAQLQGKIPAFGRHAGAALVANGQISQDQLWPVLRAHAEWVLRRAIASESGTGAFETAPPARLKGEPSVFGGATGAEVLIEVVRRAVPADVAAARIGGLRARLVDGPRRDLLGECALTEAELDALNRGRGSTLGELLAEHADLGPTVYALVELAVLDIERDTGGKSSAREPSVPPPDSLDADALRAQVRARMSLVQEADYFTLLGVARTATAYEIHHAYLELRRALEPTLVLTAATADLGDDLALIIEVIEEAHDILRDQVRRERYRRAIEAKPPH